MELKFIKCHGSCNDFVLIDEIENSFYLSQEERKIFVKSICDRNGEIGSDGVLFLKNSQICDFAMCMFNPDGSEAEMCGNGLRCLARLAYEKIGKPTFTIEVYNKSFLVKKETDIYPNVEMYSIKISNVNFKTSDLPMITHREELIFKAIPKISDELLFTAMGMPNPHIVAFLPNFANDALLNRLGQKVNSNKTIFPKGVNVSLNYEISKARIFCKTYERGVGQTNSCGTAMCASAIAYTIQQHDYLNTWIDVVNNGGMVKCLVEKECQHVHVTLLGNATFEYRARIIYDSHGGKFNDMNKYSVNTDEVRAYSEFIKELSGNTNLN